jgi:hypothetical protein
MVAHLAIGVANKSDGFLCLTRPRRPHTNHSDSPAIARICNDVWRLGAPGKKRAFMPHQLPSAPPVRRGVMPPAHLQARALTPGRVGLAFWRVHLASINSFAGRRTANRKCCDTYQVDQAVPFNMSRETDDRRTRSGGLSPRVSSRKIHSLRRQVFFLPLPDRQAAGRAALRP